MLCPDLLTSNDLVCLFFGNYNQERNKRNANKMDGNKSF